MRLARVVVRLSADDREALDHLCSRYFDETKRRLSRAAVVRMMVRQALAGADGRAAADVLRMPAEAPPSSRGPAP